MDDLDKGLKTYFAKREDVPAVIQAELRQKLTALAQRTTQTISDSEPWLERLMSVIMPCAAVFALTMLLLIGAVFGHGAFLLGGVIYVLSLMSGVTVLLVMQYTITQSRLPHLEGE